MLLDCAQLMAWTPQSVETTGDDVLMRLRDFGDDAIGELPLAWNYIPQPEQIDVTLPADREPRHRDGFIDPEPPAWIKMMHWSQLSDPNGKSWIDRSCSQTWAGWRERWRASS